MVVLSNFLGSIASIYFIHRVNRRTILLFGQASISLALAGMAIMTVAEAPDLLLLMICMVTFMFQFTVGPLAPLFASEICCDVALGTVMVTEDIFVLLQDYLTPSLLDQTPTFVFSIFAMLSLGGYIFIYFLVPETKGLSEQEKKALFLPGAPYGRELKPGEN